MGLLRKAIVLALLAVVIRYLFASNSEPPLNFGGSVQPGFESVQEAFRKNFENGLEPDGAAFAVCHRGKIVVDLWGGYADKMALREWKQDTMTLVFSATKGVTALTIAVLVDRGLLKYEDLVIKYWPEFGAHGKANTTVQMLLSHEAGLAGLDSPITVEAVKDWRKMSKLFEDQVPNWPPGAGAGYHALTLGWLADQLVHRVDPQHRSLGQYFAEEIAKPFDIDFHIGLHRDQFHRVARMRPATIWDFLKRLDDWEYLDAVFTVIVNAQKALSKKVNFNPVWVKLDDGYFTLNDPDLQELEMGSANGIGTSRALARLYCLMDGTSLLNKSTIDLIARPVIVNEKDHVLGFKITWGRGFIHTISPEGHYRFGHPGFGGMNAQYDPHRHLSFAYLRNRMAPDFGEITRTYQTLQRALYETVQSLRGESSGE